MMKKSDRTLILEILNQSNSNMHNINSVHDSRQDLVDLIPIHRYLQDNNSSIKITDLTLLLEHLSDVEKYIKDENRIINGVKCMELSYRILQSGKLYFLSRKHIFTMLLFWFKKDGNYWKFLNLIIGFGLGVLAYYLEHKFMS